MVAQRNEKLHRLQRILPDRMVVDSAWLEEEGYSKSLRNKYLLSGWLERVVPGVYRRPPASLPTPGRQAAEPESAPAVTWDGVVMSLQHLLDHTDMHVGGRTALELHGFAHFLRAKGMPQIHLYSQRTLPAWLAKIPAADWVTHPRSLFADDKALADSTDDHPNQRASFDYGWREASWPIRLATPERAILEMIDELPGDETFEQVDAMFGGLATLRPKALQNLLERCDSIKVKRLFLFFADRHNHAWVKHLDKDRITLGAGKRALVPHGRYDPKYKLTVPAFLLNSPDDF